MYHLPDCSKYMIRIKMQSKWVKEMYFQSQQCGTRVLGVDLVLPAFHLCTLKITFFAFWISETSCLMGCERIALEE